MTEELTSFWFNDENSLDFGLAVKERASYKAAERQVEYIEVPGRNGSLLRDKGTFNNVEEMVPVYLYAEDRSVNNIREEASRLINWLKSPRGWCTFQYSDDPYYFMMAHMPGELELTEVFHLFNIGEGELNFIRKPERFSTEGYQIRTISKSGEIIMNPEAFESYPAIKVYGTGDITLYVNNYAIGLTGVTDPITLDSQMQNSYTDKNGIIVGANQKVKNTLPKLQSGANEIAWIGDVSKIEISPRWWTL